MGVPGAHNKLGWGWPPQAQDQDKRSTALPAANSAELFLFSPGNLPKEAQPVLNTATQLRLNTLSTVLSPGKAAELELVLANGAFPCTTGQQFCLSKLGEDAIGQGNEL